MSMRMTAVVLSAVMWLGGAVHAADGVDSRLALRTAAALYDGIQTVELSNGLRVYLKPIAGSTSVTTMVVYKVGSADEDKSWTGLSHYLEHLMFKGTEKLKPGDIDRVTFRAGGSNNAYTSTDMTAYHFTLPASRWKEALAIEADRMRNLVIDKAHEFDKEKGAVINELAGNEDSPWDLEYKAVLPRLFGKGHPYGHPIIGEAKHVQDATEKVIKEHYDRWYHPNNASLVMVGGFEPAEALGEIRKLFGGIARGTLPARKTVPSEAVKLPARYQMESKFTVPRLLLAYPTVQSGDADEAALAVMEGALGLGKRSRLYREMVEGATVASSVGAEHSPGRYPGSLLFFVEVLPGKDRAEVEKLLLAELAKLREKPITEAELKRVQQQLIADAIFRQEGTYGLANRIGQAVTLTSLETARSYLPRIVAVTPADVQRVARKYLVPEKSVTVWSVPAEKKSDLGPGRGGPSTTSRARAERESKAVGGGFDLKKTQRVELPNGMVVLLFETRRLPILEVQAVLRESAIYQTTEQLGVASLTGMLLDEGTSKRSGAEIAEAIENVGGELSLGASGGSVRVLSPDRRLGLELLMESLRQPAFAKEAFGRSQARLLAEIGESESRPETRAARLFREKVYGTHPLGRPLSGTLKTVKALRPEDCRAFHQRVFVPNNLIVAIAGDFDSKEVLAEIRRLVGDWKKNELPNYARLEVPLPAKFTQEIVTMPRAAQLQMYLGHVGIRRDNADYYKLLVMDHVLGTGPGFTDRLSGRLRDREGLAYTVSATITNSAGLEPGMFTCYIGTDTDKFAKVKSMFLEELNRIRDEKPKAQEVEDAKTYLMGSRQLQFATTGGIARQLVNIERYGLGLDYLEKYVEAVGAVTPEDVQAVAKKHLHPERMVLAAAGAVDAKGEPLDKKKKE